MHAVPELRRSAEVLSVVVSEVVVADDGGGLDAGGDEEVDEDGLELGLARLEVVAADGAASDVVTNALTKK